jgi:hypothetical protein
MRIHAYAVATAISILVANCDRGNKSIDIDPNAAARTESAGQVRNGANDFGNGSSTDSYSSTDLYSATSTDQNSALPNDSSQLGNGSSYGDLSTLSAGGGLGPNDPRPPSQGMAMAMQMLPQLLGCLQQQCNPVGLAQNLMGPMLARLGSAGGQSGGLSAAGLGQLGGLLNQGIAGLQQGGAGAQFGISDQGGEEVIDEE